MIPLDFGVGPNFFGLRAAGDKKRSKTRLRSDQTHKNASSLPFEPLEPRILLSADLLNTTALTSSLVPVLVQANPAPNTTPTVNLSASAQIGSLDAVVYPSTTPTSAPPINGSIDTPGQVDKYTFTLSAPTSLYFDS